MHRCTHMDEHSGTEGVFPTQVHAQASCGINTVWLTLAQYTYMYKRSKHKLTCTCVCRVHVCTSECTSIIRNMFSYMTLIMYRVLQGLCVYSCSRAKGVVVC